MTLQQAIFPILELSYEFTSWDVCGPHTEFQHLFHRIIDSQVWRGHLILTPLCSLNALCDIYKKKMAAHPMLKLSSWALISPHSHFLLSKESFKSPFYHLRKPRFIEGFCCPRFLVMFIVGYSLFSMFLHIFQISDPTGEAPHFLQ